MNGIPYKTELKYVPTAKRWECFFRFDPRGIQQRYSVGHFLYKRKPAVALAEMEQAFQKWVIENCR